jgi:hypothetical protein
VEWIDPQLTFPGLKTLVMVESERERSGGKKVGSVAAFFPPCRRTRSVLDKRSGRTGAGETVCTGCWTRCLDENPCRIRSGHAAENMVIIRRFAVNLPKLHTTTQPCIKNNRLRMAYDADYRNLILFGINKERGAI